MTTKRWILVTVSSAIVLGGGYLIATKVARPIYRQWRADNLTSMARSFLAQKDAANALLTARKILEKDRANVDAWRIAVAASKLRGSPEAVIYQSNLASVEKTTENYLELMRLALEYKAYRFSLDSIPLVAPSAKGNGEFHRLAAATYTALGKPTAAKYHLLSLVELSPLDKGSKIELAQIEIEEDRGRNRKDVRATLREMAEDPQYKTRALSILLSDAINGGSKSEIEDLAARLSSTANLDFPAQILIADAYETVAPRKAEELLQHLKDLASADASKVSSLISFLIRRSKFEEFAWYTKLPEAIKSEPEVQRGFAELLLKSERWAVAESFLKPQKWKDREYLRHAYLALCFRKQGLSREFQDSWKLSLVTSKLDARRTYDLLTKVDGWRWDSERFDVLWNLFGLIPENEAVRQQLIAWERQNNNTANLNKIYARIIETDAGNSIAKNNFAYSSLLLDSNLLRAQTIAKELFRENSTNPFFVTTYAFALYKSGKYQEALGHLRSLGASALSEPERMLLHAVILASAGDTVKATDILNDLPEGRLLPEERGLATAARKEIIRQERIQGKQSQLFALKTQADSAKSGWRALIDPNSAIEMTVSMQLSDSYFGSENIAALRDVLKDGGWGSSEYIRLALLSWLARRESDALQGKNYWATSLAEAGRDSARLQNLLNLAGAWGWTQERKDLHRRYFEVNPLNDSVFAELMDQYRDERNISDLVAVLSQRYTAKTSDMDVASQLAYYSLLTNINVTRAYVLAKDSFENEPNSISKLFIHAFSLWHQKRFSEASKLLEIVANDQSMATVENRALIRAAIFADTGRKELARLELKKLDTIALSAEERRLVSTVGHVAKEN